MKIWTVADGDRFEGTCARAIEGEDEEDQDQDQTRRTRGDAQGKHFQTLNLISSRLVTVHRSREQSGEHFVVTSHRRLVTSLNQLND